MLSQNKTFQNRGFHPVHTQKLCFGGKKQFLKNKTTKDEESIRSKLNSGNAEQFTRSVMLDR
jgi:hypothetical protein